MKGNAALIISNNNVKVEIPHAEKPLKIVSNEFYLIINILITKHITNNKEGVDNPIKRLVQKNGYTSSRQLSVWCSEVVSS